MRCSLISLTCSLSRTGSSSEEIGCMNSELEKLDGGVVKSNNVVVDISRYVKYVRHITYAEYTEYASQLMMINSRQALWTLMSVPWWWGPSVGRWVNRSVGCSVGGPVGHNFLKGGCGVIRPCSYRSICLILGVGWLVGMSVIILVTIPCSSRSTNLRWIIIPVVCLCVWMFVFCKILVTA